MKKIIALFLSAVTAVLLNVSVNAVSVESGRAALSAQFRYGSGPNVDGYAIDYRYFSPAEKSEDKEEVNENETETETTPDEEVNENETETTPNEEANESETNSVKEVNEEKTETDEEEPEEEEVALKYPLVVWIHGHSFGQYEGYQIKATDISYWASDEYQSRFGDAGGAYIMAVRAPEDDGISWNEDLVKPLRFAIDDFILKHSDTVDTSRIYIGGFSIGGEMTFNMCGAYPDMFAAAFPICPHIKLQTVESSRFADIPIWLVSGKNDMLVSYRRKTLKNWNTVLSTTNVASDCRFSTLNDVCEPDGSLAPSAHYSWIAVTNDMFSAANGSYPEMSTVNGRGETVELTYPNGMISWLSQFSSQYSVENIDISDTGSNKRNLNLFELLKAAFMRVYIPLRNAVRLGV